MRILKVLFICALVVAATGCTCRTRGANGDNLGDSGEGPMKDVNFAFDSYALDATAKSIIEANAQYLKENPEVKVKLEGYCDERGTNEYNVVLGNNRANAVDKYLKTLGIADRTSTTSFGEELPLDPGHNEAAWAKNRRVHFNSK